MPELYDDSQGYRRMNMDSSLGKPEDIADLNIKHQRAAEGAESKTLDQLYQRKATLEYDIDNERVAEVDRGMMQRELAEVKKQIRELENPDSQDSRPVVN